MKDSQILDVVWCYDIPLKDSLYYSPLWFLRRHVLKVVRRLNPCFSRKFHVWEMDAVQNFFQKVNEFGWIRLEEDKTV